MVLRPSDDFSFFLKVIGVLESKVVVFSTAFYSLAENPKIKSVYDFLHYAEKATLGCRFNLKLCEVSWECILISY